MIDLQTFTQVDSVVCKMIRDNTKANSSENNFIAKPTFTKPSNTPFMEETTCKENTEGADINTARYYAVSDGVIHESFSTCDDLTDDTKMLEQTETPTPEDVIVVISDDIQHEELVNLYNKLKNRLKCIVHYGTGLDVKQVFEHFAQIVSVDSLSNAVNKSHLLAQNGQTIFFPKVSSNFDFFGHINFA